MKADGQISVFIIDDHPVITDCLAEYLRRQPGFTVAGTSLKAESALPLLRQNPPDVLILDIELPGENAFEFARRLTVAGNDIKILFFTAFLTDAYLLEASTLPLFGYLTKSVSMSELAEGVRTLADGRHVFSQDVLARFPAGINSVMQKIPKTRLGSLTAREREVLKYIASDMTGKEIAARLGLSSRTIDRHKANIMDKLGIHSQVGLTRFAVAEGLCQPSALT
jgi:DNA-binding NarL/FixJ family response regulator